jgi:hypothetical protein
MNMADTGRFSHGSERTWLVDSLLLSFITFVALIGYHGDRLRCTLEKTSAPLYEYIKLLYYTF